MKICVFGLWHLGSVTAACLASVGHQVMGLDFDQQVVEKLSTGKAPLFEPGLDELLQQGIAQNNLHFATEPSAVGSTEVLWVTFDTPVDEDDCADVEFVFNAVKKVLPFLPVGAIVLISSQLPVQSVQTLESFAAKTLPEKKLSFACSPENLRLGKALSVFLNPDRVIMGVRTEADKNRLETLLAPITERIEWMCVESAEMTKHAINSFLALSVAFANELATVCEAVGADAKDVERGLKTEQRIGPSAYLAPGGAFAGGTLARDIMFLGETGRGFGFPLPIISGVKASNDNHKNWVRRKLAFRFPSLDGITVAVWGLTYKPGTDTLRRSLSVELCNWLLKQGASIKTHDPSNPVLPKQWQGRVVPCDSPLEALEGASALVVGTEWPLYRELPVEQLASRVNGLPIYDANRFLKTLYSIPGFDIIAVGMPEKERL